MGRRQIIHIDEDLCTGCGECVPSCAEGALEIVDGKVRVVQERLCDGLGACLGACPEGALTIEERDAPEFDEEAVAARLAELQREMAAEEPASGSGEGLGDTDAGRDGASAAEEAARLVFGGGGCPGARTLRFERGGEAGRQTAGDPAAPGAGFVSSDAVEAHPDLGVHPERSESLLEHWPVKLELVNPLSPSFRSADLVIAADCAPVAYRMFHEDFLAGRSVAIACPKLGSSPDYLEKLAELFQAAQPRSVTVAHMEVPCCFGLVSLVRRAAELSGLKAPVEDVVITVEGRRQESPQSPPARR
ncbi:MAG: 4Fe-4S binding protein [Thermoleophilia bacterium]